MLTQSAGTTPRIRWRSFFHVTHVDNLPRIRRDGLLPHLARGSRMRVWLADLQMVPWAVNHVCESHGWHHDDVVVIRVAYPVDLLSRFREGVFCSYDVIPSAWLGCSIASQRLNKWPHGSVQSR
jgi:hypothetical protein